MAAAAEASPTGAGVPMAPYRERDLKGRVAFFECDIADAEAVKRTMAAVRERFGHLDVRLACGAELLAPPTRAGERRVGVAPALLFPL